MQTDEDAVRENALGLLDDVEADEGDLHGEDAAEDVEGGVGDVESVRVTTYVGESDERYG